MKQANKNGWTNLGLRSIEAVCVTRIKILGFESHHPRDDS